MWFCDIQMADYDVYICTSDNSFLISKPQSEYCASRQPWSAGEYSGFRRDKYFEECDYLGVYDGWNYSYMIRDTYKKNLEYRFNEWIRGENCSKSEEFSFQSQTWRWFVMIQTFCWYTSLFSINLQPVSGLPYEYNYCKPTRQVLPPTVGL